MTTRASVLLLCSAVTCYWECATGTGGIYGAKGKMQPAWDCNAHCSLQLFSEYDCPWVRRGFGLHFNQFMDTLNVFALGSGAELVLRFPGANEELICE